MNFRRGAMLRGRRAVSIAPRIEECSIEFEHTLSDTHAAARRIYLFGAVTLIER